MTFSNSYLEQQWSFFFNDIDYADQATAYFSSNVFQIENSFDYLGTERRNQPTNAVFVNVLW